MSKNLEFQEVINRREVLKQMGAMGAGVVAGSVVASRVASAATHAPTPPQTEGPFYPVADQPDKDADLTQVAGRSVEALGERLRLSGTVIDATTGRVIAGALVEFWQACATGRYNHPEDTNTAELDPNFQYWAQVRSASNGEFSIKTIVPGAYPAEPTWIRPPHIHVKVTAPGYPSLTTQIYFKGNPYNSRDRILQNLSPAQQAMVTLDLKEPLVQGGASTASWSIYLSRFRSIDSVQDGNQIETPEIQ
jgi:protocatechuate 3,4-dioxygenase, beta subunit